MSAEAPLSTFALSDMALQSAVELEKAHLGAPFDAEQIHGLARALSLTVSPDDQQAPYRFVEPGYYEPFERLYQYEQSSAVSDSVESVEALQAYFESIVQRLQSLDAMVIDRKTVEDLKVFCVALHRELIRELSSDGPGAWSQWRRPDIATAFGFG